MISHAYKCIFIHIPRCAGTSIETWLCGLDWWDVECQSKHIIASQARRLYADWWDDYFKFSFVRDPYMRTLSLLKYGEHFGLRKDGDGTIDFSAYNAMFGADIVVEHDHRFANREQLLTRHHRPGCVYGNILDENLDFVGRFESLAADLAIVQSWIGFPQPFDLHVERSQRSERQDLTGIDRAWVAKTYADDFSRFGYPAVPAVHEQKGKAAT